MTLVVHRMVSRATPRRGGPDPRPWGWGIAMVLGMLVFFFALVVALGLFVEGLARTWRAGAPLVERIVAW